MPNAIRRSLIGTLFAVMAWAAFTAAPRAVAYADDDDAPAEPTPAEDTAAEAEEAATPEEAATEAEEATAEEDKPPAESPDCPTDLPGAEVAASPIREGAAILFLSPNEEVDELRRRVRTLARTQNKGATEPPETAPLAVQEEAAAEGGAEEPHDPIATVYDVDGGAMLRLTPSKLDHLDDVQNRGLEYAQRLAGGNCPLVRDERTVVPADKREIDNPPSVQTPAGNIPGVGAIDGAAVIITPSLVL
jgi:hypothetical protein